jgi:hypothetical protein
MVLVLSEKETVHVELRFVRVVLRTSVYGAYAELGSSETQTSTPNDPSPDTPLSDTITQSLKQQNLYLIIRGVHSPKPCLL